MAEQKNTENNNNQKKKEQETDSRRQEKQVVKQGGSSSQKQHKQQGGGDGSNSDDNKGSNFQLDPVGKYRRMFFYVVLGILLIMWIWSTTGNGGFMGQFSEIQYSTFRDHVKNGQVESVSVKGERIQGVLAERATKITPAGDTTSYSQFVTYYPSFAEEELMTLLNENDVEIASEPSGQDSWWTMLIWFLPLILMVLIGFMFFRRMQGQGQQIFNIGQSKAKLHEGSEEDTKFDDVAGADGAKEELEEIIDFLKEPERFSRIGGRVPKGVLLVGPPGTGKTLLARAVAGEAGVPFYSITGSDFMEMFVGVGAKRVRDMFKKAKERSPAIIFIDELDSIGRQRGAGLGGGHDEREQTLNQLLAELDGFEKTENVIVMAATNRPDILDQALLRPGRFDRQVTVDLPMKEARKEILQIHARNKQFDENVDMDEVARSTPGFSGADLENLLNEAALLTARDKREKITNHDIEQARDKVMMGLERKGMVITDEEREMLAYHEAGHAVVAAVMKHADPIHKVTIIPRGKAMGVTQQMPKEDKYLYIKEYMLDRMAVIMGGRAAEGLIFNTSTSGAANDLKQVTDLSRRMVMEWGMSTKFEHIAFGNDQQQVFLGRDMGNQRQYSDVTAREIDEEVNRLTQEAYDRARKALRDYNDVLKKVAELLIEKDEVPGSMVMELLGITDGHGASSLGHKKLTEDKHEVADKNAASGATADQQNRQSDGQPQGSQQSDGGQQETGDKPSDSTGGESSGEQSRTNK